MTAIETPYRFRARIIGCIEWICPHCGYLQAGHLNRDRWRIQCKNNACRKHVGFGLRCYDLSGLAGQPSPMPDDYLMPERGGTITPVGKDVHEVVIP